MSNKYIEHLKSYLELHNDVDSAFPQFSQKWIKKINN